MGSAEDINPSRPEVYLTNAESGYADAREGRVAVELQQLVDALAPDTLRVGGLEPLDAGGAVYTWEGRDSDTGETVRMRFFVRSINNHAVMLMALGTRQQLEAREPVLRQMVASFAFPAAENRREAPAPQPAGRETALTDGSEIAGQWAQRLRGKMLTQLSSYSSGSAGGYSSRTTIYLGPDGRFSGGSSSSVSVDVPGASGSSGGTNRAAGRWFIYRSPDGQAVLRLQHDGNPDYEHNALQDRNGQTWINGARWFVTDRQ